ncbi:Unknown protein sequence [Pseudomonas syringae pv. lapsa]|uniref:Uncharacterized protein n=1 Tax=Pseudomonas syringae pv. lapsa TaxID=199201 RepID=A0AB74A4D6_PSESX|nr:Unknown protein sequence [Pseudomonas syringae pv. lapsa]RML24975.1 hypothetical protein ALQ98_00026 [Pseudomonas syringae pv. lapsa]
MRLRKQARSHKISGAAEYPHGSKYPRACGNKPHSLKTPRSRGSELAHEEASAAAENLLIR